MKFDIFSFVLERVPPESLHWRTVSKLRSIDFLYCYDTVIPYCNSIVIQILFHCYHSGIQFPLELFCKKIFIIPKHCFQCARLLEERPRTKCRECNDIVICKKNAIQKNTGQICLVLKLAIVIITKIICA